MTSKKIQGFQQWKEMLKSGNSTTDEIRNYFWGIPECVMIISYEDQIHPVLLIK